MRGKHRIVRVPAGSVILEANLEIPDGADGIVVFAHGSGSSRFSARNIYVADVLNGIGIATLLVDLLTVEEDALDLTARIRFDIDLLKDRLAFTTNWLEEDPETRDLPMGYFGASTGAAAALAAAAARPEAVRAVVSRGGRPDLAGDALSQVTTPTLLIVGSLDIEVLRLNEEALESLVCEKRLEIISGATHLFEEASALEQVARLAGDWFIRYLVPQRVAR